MTTQDTITIPRDLGPWLIACHLEPQSAPGVDQERYTPKAAHALIRDGLAAKPGPMPEPTTSTAWSRAQAKRITQLTKESEAALDDVARLRQEITAEKARYSEVLATTVDNKELAETKIAAQATRIQTLCKARDRLEFELYEGRAAWREAAAKIESMTAAGLEAAADKLEAEIAITPEQSDAIAARLAAMSTAASTSDDSLEAMAYKYIGGCQPGECLTITHVAGVTAVTMTRDRRPLVAPTTPATTPDE